MKRLALLALLALASCSSDGATCRDDSDCGSNGGKILCDKGDSPPGVCRQVCGSDGKQCNPTVTVPPEGKSDECAATQRCLCNPVRGYFFCEVR